MKSKSKSKSAQAGQRNAQRGASHVGSGDLVVLLCRKCGAKTKTKRESYEPPEVATVTCICPKCDNGGGFDDLQYLDAKGRDIGDIYAKHNIEARQPGRTDHG